MRKVLFALVVANLFTLTVPYIDGYLMNRTVAALKNIRTEPTRDENFRRIDLIDGAK